MKKYNGVSFGLPLVQYAFACESLVEFAEEVRQRKTAGHALISSDCPVGRMIGFQDSSNGELIGIGLTYVKEGLSMNPELRDCFFTPAARQKFLER